MAIEFQDDFGGGLGAWDATFDALFNQVSVVGGRLVVDANNPTGEGNVVAAAGLGSWGDEDRDYYVRFNLFLDSWANWDDDGVTHPSPYIHERWWSVFFAMQDHVMNHTMQWCFVLRPINGAVGRIQFRSGGGPGDTGYSYRRQQVELPEWRLSAGRCHSIEIRQRALSPSTQSPDDPDGLAIDSSGGVDVQIWINGVDAVGTMHFNDLGPDVERIPYGITFGTDDDNAGPGPMVISVDDVSYQPDTRIGPLSASANCPGDPCATGGVTQTEILFEDYFVDTSLSEYDPSFRKPLPLAGDEMSFRVVQAAGPSGENCARFTPPSYFCPACPDVGFDPACGTPDANCYFGMNLMRPDPVPPGVCEWRHLRAWIRPHGIWDTSGNDNPRVMGIVFADPGGGCIIAPEHVNPYWSVYIDAEGGPKLVFSFTGNTGVLGGGSLYEEVAIPWEDWTCVEIAVMHSDALGHRGHQRAWVDNVAVIDSEWASGGTCGAGYPDYASVVGFFVGSWGGALAGPDKWIDFARISWADGPIGCLTRKGLPPPVPPDPDAKNCTDDEYDTHCVLDGDCGRVIARTRALTREAAGWETIGNGFDDAQSAWFKWVAPRSGRFLFRTRGSTVFNVVGVYKHTGATPPPLVGKASTDPWDPTATKSSAVEVDVDEGQEYRIRVAADTDGWVVLDWGSAYPVLQDDGWSIDEGFRPNRFRVDALDTPSATAVQDAQVAASSSGAGTQATLGPHTFASTGTTGVTRTIVRVRGTGVPAGIWHVGFFVNGVQKAQRPFSNKAWATVELPLVTIANGDVVDVRVYLVTGEASAGGQICDWRLENLSQIACDPYRGGPLEGTYATGALPDDDVREADQEARLRALEGVGDETGSGSAFADPDEWAPSEDLAYQTPPPWEESGDPLDPSSGSSYEFVPYPPA